MCVIHFVCTKYSHWSNYIKYKNECFSWGPIKNLTSFAEVFKYAFSRSNKLEINVYGMGSKRLIFYCARYTRNHWVNRCFHPYFSTLYKNLSSKWKIVSMNWQKINFFSVQTLALWMVLNAPLQFNYSHNLVTNFGLWRYIQISAMKCCGFCFSRHVFYLNICSSALHLYSRLQLYSFNFCTNQTVTKIFTFFDFIQWSP